MTFSKTDAQKIVNQSRTIIDILEMNRITDSSLAVKLVTEAIKNQNTIIVLK